MLYIGIDLAWNPNNYSGVSLLEENKVLYSGTMKGLENIINFINQYPKAQVGIDAPLKVSNESGNREIEKEFLKDFASKKLGVYPVNRSLLLKNHGVIAGEKIAENISQKLGESLFEVYPHATIMNCFHGSVLPYKRKKGRDTAFIKEQLSILINYLVKSLEGSFVEDITQLKGESLKHYEDRLDAIISAYTLYICNKFPYKLYGEIFKVPNLLNLSSRNKL